MLASETQIIISSIGWALIHFLWQGALITLAYWIITRSVQSIHLKYWTGMSLVVVSLVVPLLNLKTISTSGTTAVAVTELSQTIISHQQLNMENLFFYLVNASLPYIVLIWGLTVMFLSFRLVKSWVQLASIRHECDPKVSSQLKQYIKNIAIKLDLPTIPLLKVSPQVLVPAAYGILKPTVLLPISLISQMPKDQLEAIIKHELCHLKRNDFIHNIIQLCADILLFFHPGIRWMNNDIRHVREQCCDQMVLSHKTEALTYAKALTNIASFTNGLKLKHSVHLGANDGVLLKRVKFLLQNKSSQSSLMIFMPFLLLITFIAVLLQPANTEVDYPLLENDSTLQSEPLLPQTANKKRIREQQFYPQITLQQRQQATTVVDEPSPSRQLSARSNPAAINKSSLLDELTTDMQLNSLQTNVLLDDVANLSQEVPTDLVLNYVPEVVVATEQVVSAAPVFDVPAVSASKQQELSSFAVTDSIKPKFKKYAEPVYPQHFWFNQIEQEVIASFKINSNGRVYDINLASQSNKYLAFEQEVIKAMRKWRFDTTSLNNSTLQRTYQQIFSFAISDEVEKNCNLKTTGSRLSKAMPCNK